MNCKNCGYPLKNDDQFCPNCGNIIEKTADIIEIVDEEESNHDEVSSAPVNVIVENKPVKNNIPKEEQFDTKDWKAATSLIIGIISLLFAFIVNIYVLPLAIFGLIIGILSKQKGALKTVGIILNSIAIVCSIVVIFVLTAISMGAFDTNYFEGDGFKYQYNYEWQESKLADGKRVLQYNGTNAFLVPVARAQLIPSLSCDYVSDSCKEDFYNYIYDSMLLGVDDETMKLEKTDTKHELLKDDIYYMMIDINQSANTTGRYYILTSKSKDVALTFLVSVKNSNISILHDKVIETLSTIEIEERDYNEDENNIEIKRIGSDKLGYVSIPSDWHEHSSSENGTSLQYKSDTSYALTMGVSDGKNAKEYAANYAKSMQDDRASNVTATLTKVANYVAYRVHGYYESENKWRVSWFFDADDKNMHYIIIEGPDSSSSNFNIPNTFKLTE